MDGAYTGPSWSNVMTREFGFAFQRGTKRVDSAGFDTFSMLFERVSAPRQRCSIAIRGRILEGNELGFGNRGVYAGASTSQAFGTPRSSIQLSKPIFGDDFVLTRRKNGFQFLQVCFFHQFSIHIYDVAQLANPPRGVPNILRDRTADLRKFEGLCRLVLARSIAELDLVTGSQAVLEGLSYQAWTFNSPPQYYRQAMSRPTTRWIKLSDWARNHDVTVTYGDMTAEYVYRGERYLLPLASDQFKKGTAWFKTSGPILMRGDDWLIPTAMVD